MTRMTNQHFNEIFYTVMKSTHSTKQEVQDHLNLTRTTLNLYLRNGVPVSKQFIIMNKLKDYLFSNLGGKEDEQLLNSGGL